MNGIWVVVLAAGSLIAGLIIGWALKALRFKADVVKHTQGYRDRVAAAEALVKDRENTIAKADEDFKTLREQMRKSDEARAVAETRTTEIEKRLQEQVSYIETVREEFSNTFKALAAEALSLSNKEFMSLAEDKFKHLTEISTRDLDARKREIEALVQPLGETLAAYQKEVRGLEEKHISALTTVNDEIRKQATATLTLQVETTKLVNALRSPMGPRGRWGEIALQRVAELAGMSEHCDFVLQEPAGTEEERIRPDMVVKLPAGREVVVDAKTPLKGYIDALDANTDEAKSSALKHYAQQVKQHVTDLASKKYWSQFELAPEFVVMFLPNDLFFSTAVEQAPDLVEKALANKIIITTPSTLIALLRAIAYGWRQEKIAENAQEICKLGQELSDRIATWATHLAKVGGALGDAVKSYDDAVGSLESRVLSQARRFTELGAVGKKEVPEVPIVGRSVRALRLPE